MLFSLTKVSTNSPSIVSVTCEATNTTFSLDLNKIELPLDLGGGWSLANGWSKTKGDSLYLVQVSQNVAYRVLRRVTQEQYGESITHLMKQHSDYLSEQAAAIVATAKARNDVIFERVVKKFILEGLTWNPSERYAASVSVGDRHASILREAGTKSYTLTLVNYHAVPKCFWRSIASTNEQSNLDSAAKEFVIQAVAGDHTQRYTASASIKGHDVSIVREAGGKSYTLTVDDYHVVVNF